MKKLIITLCCLSLILAVMAQDQDKQQILANSITASTDNYWKQQLQELYEPGISMNKDSMHISAESKKVMQNANYRALIFPDAYTWQSARQFLTQLDFKKGFWYLIKLYAADTANRPLVIQTILAYEKAFEINKVLTSTFYTYALLDPKVCVFKNDKIKITRPDILEGSFNKLKEMTNYIANYQKKNTVKK